LRWSTAKRTIREAHDPRSALSIQNPSLPNFRQVEASGHILVQFPIGDLVMKPDELQVRIDGQQAGDSYIGEVVLTTR
jgi:hypothetical protein